jgi:hypothetical protein
MAPQRSRLLLLTFLMFLLLISLGVQYLALGEVPRERDVAERAVVVKNAPIAQPTRPSDDTAGVLKRARDMFERSELFERRDNTEPILEQMHRELHEPLYNMNPRDK